MTQVPDAVVCRSWHVGASNAEEAEDQDLGAHRRHRPRLAQVSMPPHHAVCMANRDGHTAAEVPLAAECQAVPYPLSAQVNISVRAVSPKLVVVFLTKGMVAIMLLCIGAFQSHEISSIVVAHRATGLETLDWAQGSEQQAAQMFKKYIR